MAELTDQEIKHFLENAPLYKWEVFDKPRANRASLWINEVEAYCETCEQMRPFQDLRSRGGGAGMPLQALQSGESHFVFSCVSCKKQHRKYFLQQEVTEHAIRMQKVGELPRKALERDRVLQRLFAADAQNYEKAIICLANGYGIAAFAYFRRIIEANISKIFDMLQSDAQDTGGSEEILKAISELRKESPMSDKIKIANNAVPTHLRPDGLNPLGRLYQVLSEGVHTLSDEQCLDKARTLQECVKFLASELASRSEHREKFKSMVGML